MERLGPKLYNSASVFDGETLEQALRTSRMPFIFPHMAIMPDAHLGKGATVGSVIPTEGAIIPAAVGVDIGCGMIAVRTQFTGTDILSQFDRSVMRELIEQAIPLSPGNYNNNITDTAIARIDSLEVLADKTGSQPYLYGLNWHEQLGSLGGGNHFIEVSVDEEDRVWLFLHSGSRGIGNKMAQHHIKKAIEVSKKYFISLEDKDLAYLVEETEEFEDYINDLNWAQQFALYNREEMMDRVIQAFETWTGESVVESERVNCHHNYTVREQHYGRDVWLSRKGAIHAGAGVAGLIPGSMGTRSYVVEGLGNPLSLNTAPHGAGRNFSRTRAKATFSMADLEESMVGIEWNHSPDFIDEIPGAYKDIDVVMHDARDLVAIKHTLRQIINVKGT